MPAPCQAHREGLCQGEGALFHVPWDKEFQLSPRMAPARRTRALGSRPVPPLIGQHVFLEARRRGALSGRPDARCSTAQWPAASSHRATTRPGSMRSAQQQTNEELYSTCCANPKRRPSIASLFTQTTPRQRRGSGVLGHPRKSNTTGFDPSRSRTWGQSKLFRSRRRLSLRPHWPNHRYPGGNRAKLSSSRFGLNICGRAMASVHMRSLSVAASSYGHDNQRPLPQASFRHCRRPTIGF